MRQKMEQKLQKQKNPNKRNKPRLKKSKLRNQLFPS